MNPIELWNLPDGTPLTLRPVCAQDAPALSDLIEHLSARDRRLRFHAATNGLSHARLRRMTRVDQHHHLALAVTTPAPQGEVLIADARWVVDEGGDAAEVALVVAEAWRRRGVGERCMHALRRAAADRGLRWLYGSVLPENTPMLALMRRCGFRCSACRTGAALVTVELGVDASRHSEVPALATEPLGMSGESAHWPRSLGCYF